MTPDAKDRKHWRKLFKSRLTDPFRGAIEDYARTIKLGSGYIGKWSETNLCRTCRAKGIERCRHFEIDTARHLLGPFRAIADPNVRVVMLLKAAQTAGSLVWDMCVHYFLVHSEFVRIKVLMDCDPKAVKYCNERLMETLRNNRDIKPMIPTGIERFAATQNALRLLNGKTLFVGGLNESNASSLPADVMILDEGWLHQSDGLMKKAFDRLKQQEHGKIIVVGQAGNVKEDQDRIWESLHKRVPLTWACPCCGGRQQFELNKQRPSDFVARRALPDAHLKFNLSNLKEPKPGSYVGFKIPKKFSELMTTDDIKSASSQTTIECYFCGFEIPDTPQMRSALNDSYEQEYRETDSGGRLFTPPDYTVGFWNPDPASVNVSFSETMQEYILAYRAKELKNFVPMQTFYLSRWAQPWNPAQAFSAETAISPGSYDPSGLVESVIPNEHSRNMAVDCQENGDHKKATGVSITGWFWYVVRVFDKFGNSKQLARGYCKSEDEWRAVQRHWKVPNDRLMIDSVQWSEQVIQLAVKFRDTIKMDKPHPIFKTNEKTVTFKCLAASPGKNNFKGHRDGIIRPWSPEMPVYGTVIDDTGHTRRIPINRILFNKTPIQLQVDALYSGATGMPKFEVLGREHLKRPNGTPDALTLEMESGMRTYQNQMSSQYYDQQENKYVELRPDDHYYWCEQAIVVRVGMDGILGQSAVYQEA